MSRIQILLAKISTLQDNPACRWSAKAEKLIGYYDPLSDDDSDDDEEDFDEI